MYRLIMTLMVTVLLSSCMNSPREVTIVPNVKVEQTSSNYNTHDAEVEQTFSDYNTHDTEVEQTSSNYNTRDAEVVFGDEQTYPRIALIIGNNNYQKNKRLTNAVPDARAMRDFLKKRDFKVVYTENADLATMREKVDEFMSSLGKKSVTVIYYSGHASQDKSRLYNGELTNYLIPIDDKRLVTITDYDRKTISLNYILSKVDELNHGLNIAILDACRTSIGKGNQPVQNIGATGIYLIYATASGITASDSGLFRKSFIRNAKKPLKLIDVMEAVKLEVYNKEAQSPSILNDKRGTFFFTNPHELKPSFQVVDRIRPPKIVTPILNSISTPKMLQISRGSFAIVTNKDGKQLIKQIDVDYDFEIGEYEVTIGEYKRCIKDARCKQPIWLEKGNKYNIHTGNNMEYKKKCLKDDCPIIGVNWYNAKGYIQWLNQKTGKKYRLPTETEFKYLTKLGIEQVGIKKVNKKGSEWCENWTDSKEGGFKVIYDDSLILRGQLGATLTTRDSGIGFRLQRTLP